MTMFVVKYHSTQNNAVVWSFKIFGVGSNILVRLSQTDVANGKRIVGYLPFIKGETPLPTPELRKSLKRAGIDFRGVVCPTNANARLMFEFTDFARRVFYGNLCDHQPYCHV
jgi:hypothetical protein